MLESAINHFSEAELFSGSGIQSVINKLNSIKHNPCYRQLAAVERFADQLARIDTFEKIQYKYVAFDEKSGQWRAKRHIRGKVFYCRSKNKEVVLNAYQKFCKEQGLM